MQGERVTWSKVSAIQANCGIEMHLDQCMVQLGQQINQHKAQQQQQQQQQQQLETRAASKPVPVRDMRPRAMHKLARTPSWINMTAMGARSASWAVLCRGQFPCPVCGCMPGFSMH